MQSLGWIGWMRPRMFSVRAAGCAPIVRAFEAGETSAAEFPDARTCASGLRVPKAVGDFLMLKILRGSKGGAVTVEDEEMICANREVGAAEGIFVAREGAASWHAQAGRPRNDDADERVVISIPAPESSISSVTK